jgi:3',5'-cyclic AMP phosphodiesterase CpdA
VRGHWHSIDNPWPTVRGQRPARRLPSQRAGGGPVETLVGADWLLVAGDVAETVSVVTRTLALLRSRFAVVVWAPGNHELWTISRDPVGLRGEARSRHLVDVCRRLEVLTPEDSYPVYQTGQFGARLRQGRLYR